VKRDGEDWVTGKDRRFVVAGQTNLLAANVAIKVARTGLSQKAVRIA
jgi:hypothetical protein